MLEQYKIHNTSFLNPSVEYSDSSMNKSFQQDLENFKDSIMSNIHNEESLTYYKFGDGDYYFLKKEKRGSAKPGIRALKKPYFMINHRKFVTGSKKNDVYMSLSTKMHKAMFLETFSKHADFASEFVYGLLANKWLLQASQDKVGIIGADKKLELINLLMEKDQYQNYLGIDKFHDYIDIPQRFACDNLNKTIKHVEKQLNNSTSKIFLVGVGHVKSGLLHELKKIKKAIYIDVGVGIDALAGIVNLSRPYFGDWKNFQFRNSDLYSDIDLLVNKNNNIKNINFLD